MKLRGWRSVRQAHAAEAFTGGGAARFPGRYNEAGVRAVYLADCPAGCALELVATYAAPEALSTHVLFEVEVDAPLVDLRVARTLRHYGVTADMLIRTDDHAVPRRVARQLLAERKAGAIVPSTTVARACNVVIYPALWSAFVVHGPPQALALDRRLLRKLSG